MPASWARNEQYCRCLNSYEAGHTPHLPIICAMCLIANRVRCPSFATNSDFGMDSVRSEGGGLFRSIRTLGSAIAVLSAMASSSYAVDTRQDPSSVTCTNPVSGVHWQIVIDYQKKTVDSFPAAITRSEISWFDPRDQGYNTIDRASGELVTAVGSSTGGWLRHNRCSLEQPR